MNYCHNVRSSKIVSCEAVLSVFFKIIFSLVMYVFHIELKLK